MSMYQDDDTIISSNFECGNGENIEKIAGVYHVTIRLEPGEHAFSGTGSYFCLALKNLSERQRQIELVVHGNIEHKFGAGTREVVLRRTGHVGEGIPVDTEEAVSEWDHLDPANILPEPDSDNVTLKVDLPACTDEKPVLHLCNFHWYPFTSLEKWIDTIRGRTGVYVSLYGRSVEGQPLYRLDLGNPQEKVPHIVMSQTPQPSEMGTWACRAIVEFLLAGDGGAREILANYRLTILPETNPDGRKHGLCVSHPLGRMPYFEGKLTVEEPEKALPEMRGVWDLLTELRPFHFVEWHSNNWDRRPGHVLLRYRPQLLSDPELIKCWETIDRELLSLPDTYHGNWTSHDEGIYQVSIGFQAVTRLGCIAHMIKQHDKFPLRQNLDHAVACLKIICRRGKL